MYPKSKRVKARNEIANWTRGIQDRINEGWNVSIIIVMFNQLRGNQPTINLQMRYAIEGRYASLITRMYRDPNRQDVQLPGLIACPDWPVFKHDKKTISEIITNDGLHYHGLLLIPPLCPKWRLKASIKTHSSITKMSILDAD
jgi:hypothetical protein